MVVITIITATWVCFMLGIFRSKQIIGWSVHQFRKAKVKKVIHKVLVEPDADPTALAFALATSEIESKDLYAASEILPAAKNRFGKKEKASIAENAFLLRTDEHADFYFDPDNFGTKLHFRVREIIEMARRARLAHRERRARREDHHNPLIIEIRDSLRQMVNSGVESTTPESAYKTAMKKQDKKSNDLVRCQ